jgi:hypothetical protein
VKASASVITARRCWTERLIRPDFARECHRVLRLSGSFRMITDDPSYYDGAMRTFPASRWWRILSRGGQRAAGGRHGRAARSSARALSTRDVGRSGWRLCLGRKRRNLIACLLKTLGDPCDQRNDFAPHVGTDPFCAGIIVFT